MVYRNGGQQRAGLGSVKPSSAALRACWTYRGGRNSQEGPGQPCWQGLHQGRQCACGFRPTLSWGCPPLPGTLLICILGTQL